MKRVLIATSVALAFAVSLAAQAPASQEKPQPTAGQAPAAQSSAAEKSITLKGCLRAGDTPDSFVLANAAPASATTGTSGAAAPAAAAPKTVRLIGSPAGTNLKDHVGHTVEISGMIAPAKSSTPSATSTPAPGAAGASSGASESLNVKNVKHVDAKCGA